MLLPNSGTLQIAFPKAVGAFDADGFPVEGAPEWSEFVQCQWRTEEFDNAAVSEGEPYTNIRYRVLIEWDEDALDAERLLLNGVELSVKEARPLKAVRKVLFLATPRCL